MKALTKKTKTMLLVATVAAVLLMLLLVLFLPELVQPALWTLLILGLGFFLLEWYFRRKKRVKQQNFDEKVAAKEGIEDRKREWAGWIEELERQGIDRYELPFYLVVGEPQSGKSVLLQNSDLYFPFGQERLSGVGGTRGCDWWFTDEAVILDIAGRLFTHEGGVADKLEWEAFLDQLNSFRPLCPANGVLLVIPCDALLEDSPEVCADKANKIQSALLTLTQKLQAQLPVYLVMTKGDRIFGFAESVHRLDGDDRHQMFGWSREADKVEQPFALDEAKAGFARLVDRARLLREKMIASARLPEALPEIDRLYAFPDELAGLYGSLEIYLKRIFTQSTLVDRTAFRGIYLCSGLQTGAPVARVCADLLGDDRESDARALESLFSHQRAYFIKELVRNRVFVERGLVRPTEGRVLAARRNAMLGYGAAAALALVAVIGSAVHLLRDRDSDVETKFRAAVAAGESAVRRTEVRGLLLDLDAIDAAVQADLGLMHEVFKSTREGFEGLYAKVCDRALLPALRRGLEEKISARAATEPVSYDQFVELLQAATWLFDTEGIDFSRREALDLAKKWLAADYVIRVTDDRGGQADFTVADALAKRRATGKPIARIGERTRLDPLARRLLEMLNRSIDPATPWMARGHFGYITAWRGAQDALKRLRQASERQGDDLLQLCDVFANAVRTLDEIAKGPKLAEGFVTNAAFVAERAELFGTWALLSQFVDPTRGDAKWTQLTEIDVFARPIFDAHQSQAQLPKVNLFNGVLGRLSNQYQQDLMGTMLAKVPVPPSEIGNWLNDGNGELAACVAAPKSNWTLRSIEGVLATNHRLGSVYISKVKVMAQQLPSRLPDWAAARTDYYRDVQAPAAGELDQRLLGALATIRVELNRFGLAESAAALHVAKLLEEHLRTIEVSWTTRTDWGVAVDWTIPTALLRLAQDPAIGAAVSGLADQLCWHYLGQHETRLLAGWSGHPQRTDQTLAIIASLNEHLDKLKTLETVVNAEQPAPLSNPDHQRWLEQVDEFVADRLQVHLQALESYWRPQTDGWLDLRTTVESVKEALAAQTVRKKIADGRRSVDAPAADAPELRASQPISVTTSLPQVAKALAALRAFTMPSETDVRKHAIATQLLTVCGQIDQQLTAASSRELAATALALVPLPAGAPELSTVEHYLRPLHQVLRERLVAEVRSRYVRKLAEVVNTRGPTLMDALYAAGATQINAVDDQEVIRRLGQLLDPEGQFDVLRREFGMEAKPDAAHLRPSANFTPQSTVEAGWWQFEGFLVALQPILTTGGVKIGDAAFRVRFELPARAGGVWDIDELRKQFCYYAASSSGKGSPGFVSYSDRWGTLDQPLEWAFATNKRPLLWFVWTHKLRTQAFRWPGDKQDGDLSFELTGSLAPLLLAWSGSADAGWWNVQLEPAGTTEKAKLRLGFQALDGADLTVPKRPSRPTPF